MPASTFVPPTGTGTAANTFIPPSNPANTPIPTAALIPHPMSITSMRTGDYPGSEITIVKELDKGSNYRRYYAYYLSEGLKIYALLTLPNGDIPEGGWPVIVFNHGYIPPNVYRTTERYIAYVDEIAKADYIVFRIDYRGHDASEGDAAGAVDHVVLVARILGDDAMHAPYQRELAPGPDAGRDGDDRHFRPLARDARGGPVGGLPDRVGNGNLPSGDRNYSRWFDPSAFERYFNEFGFVSYYRLR